MESHILPKVDVDIEKSTLISSIIIGGAVAVASVLARRGAERTWSAAFKEVPPNKQNEDDIDIKDAILWSATIGVVTGITRLCVRRLVRKRAFRATGREDLQ